jgi:hypothetical protein
MPVQRDEAWLAAATAEQITAAQVAGELSVLLGAEVNELGNRPDELRGIARPVQELA